VLFCTSSDYYYLVVVTVIGYTVVQLVEALCYKLEGCRFDSQWCQWDFLQTFQPHCGPEVSASKRNEYQVYFLGVKDCQCVRLTLPPSCADCLEILEPQPPGTLTA
jgi:hypothetical protein